MLLELHISNLAVIADARIELVAGLNCFTGQTGAGKSLLIGALEILLGLRTAQDMLRQGASEGRVSGVFHIRNAALRKELAQVTDVPLEAESEVMITRRFYESGRSSTAINGQPISAGMLKAVGELLVDVHGQHDLQYLLKPANQLLILDDFGGCGELREAYRGAFSTHAELVRRREELLATSTLRTQQLDLYGFQVREIDDAAILENEPAELLARYRLLSNMEKIQRQAAAACGALYEDEGAALERVRGIAHVLEQLAELDENLLPVVEQIKSAGVMLDEGAFALRRYVGKLELDPNELAEVTQRLNQVNKLLDKYGGSQGRWDELQAYRAKIGAELAQLEQNEQDSTAMDAQIAAAQKQRDELGAKLTAARKLAAKKLAPLVEGHLADLGMKEAQLVIDLPPADHSPTGREGVEFMIAPNPGQPARPLRKIASGGELARVMLGLKSILAGVDRVSVLVFDEIDANVGGRMGTVIGEKLRTLAQTHQVLCITHLPQIAAYGQQHLSIHKETRAGASFTNVKILTGSERVREIAEMTSGSQVTQIALAQAQELLDMAKPKIATPPAKPASKPAGKVASKPKG
jgi:DNA repair protein RecN (Recombination protein N)